MAGPAPDKPIDLGNGSICASFGASGAWLSLGAPHPHHGFVELNALPAFDEAWRGDAAATRRYRSWMVEERYAFLRLEVDAGEPLTPLAVDMSEPSCPRWRGTIGGLAIEAEATPGPRGIIQRWLLTPRGERRTDAVRLVFGGRLDRPALAEITETNPPSPTGGRTEIRATGGRLLITTNPIGAQAAISVDGGASWRVEGREGALVLATSEQVELTIACTMESVASGNDPIGDADPDDPMTSRALAYVRGSTALAVAPGERAIVTDHRILPLSWTRDAYYQALLLLATGERPDRARVADHLRWLWTRCERPDGRWTRSHHANGQRKDLAFQADQQLYPILELADYWRATGELPRLTSDRWSSLVDAAWDATLAERDSDTGLMGTAENAADDPAAAPFIFASQILLWYASRRLAELAAAGVVAGNAHQLRRLGEAVRASIARHFLVEGPLGPQWAYAVDGAGRAELYHDANDVPTALAPAWGFCPPDDTVWRTTMRFAFSRHNPGFFPGARGGLGSVHTPAPWTLGDVQAWVVARLTNDPRMTDEALRRLRDVAFADGMLPEAYGAEDDGDPIRHWFAWPGALLGALRLLDARGRLGDRLAA